jgi:thiol-disulfide isomerase/thioredoxin
MTPRLIALCLGLSVVAGCRQPAPTVAGASAGDGLQWYRASVITADGARVPFFLSVPDHCDAAPALIVNGDERIEVDCRQTEMELLLDFPVWGTRIEAVPLESGALEGSWIRPYMAEPEQRMAFSATPIATPDPALRFTETPEGAQPAADLSGTWEMQFEAHGPAKGMLEQTAGGVVNGTAAMPSEYGDLRYLTGAISGDRLTMSTFDGQHAYLLEAVVGPDGTLSGSFRCCGEIHDTFVAERSEDFDVVDPLRQVRILSEDRRLDLEALRDPKYDGKAVVIEIFGTWCPNCNDLAPLLTELYGDHREEGLELLGIAYELSDDTAYTQARLAAYREKHGLTWEVVLAAEPPEELLGRGPARFSAIEGVPVTIFLNRDRTVRAVYAGFLGPAAGEAHEEAITTLRDLTRQILDSPAS